MSKSNATVPSPSQTGRYAAWNGSTTSTQPIGAKPSMIAVATCTPMNVVATNEMFLWMPAVTNRGHRSLIQRTASVTPRTTDAVSRTRETTPVARVMYHIVLVSNTAGELRCHPLSRLTTRRWSLPAGDGGGRPGSPAPEPSEVSCGNLDCSMRSSAARSTLPVTTSKDRHHSNPSPTCPQASCSRTSCVRVARPQPRRTRRPWRRAPRPPSKPSRGRSGPDLHRGGRRNARRQTAKRPRKRREAKG